MFPLTHHLICVIDASTQTDAYGSDAAVNKLISVKI